FFGRGMVMTPAFRSTSFHRRFANSDFGRPVWPGKRIRSRSESVASADISPIFFFVREIANPPTRLVEHSNLRHRIVIGLPVTYCNVEYGQSSIARSLPRRCSQEPGHRPAGAVLRVNPIHQGMNACGASVKRARLPLHLDPERIAPGV